MRERKYSSLFKKQIKDLKGQEAENFLNIRDKILSSTNLNHYKNLKNNLKKYKRVHVNNSYIILFFGDDNIVYFVDYEHHDRVYKKSYDNLKFE